MAAVVILLIGVFCLAFLPQMWVKGILKRHGDERADTRERVASSRAICWTGWV